MEIAFLLGRILVGLFYILSGINHFSQLEAMSGLPASKNIPQPKLMTIVTGVLLLVGGLSILTGFQPTIGVIALVLFFVPVTFTAHNFWAEQDQMMKVNQAVHFMKNLGLMGSALMFLAIPQPWPLSLGG